ncbi:MAG: hypothetical protein ABMA13_11875 [Chthoniobacteraceae bacterium]
MPDVALPRFHELSLEDAIRGDEEYWKLTVYDDAYFAWSLARKNNVPFEM